MGGRSVAVVLNQVRGVAAGRVAAHPAQQRGRGSEAKKLAPLQEEASVFMHQNLWEGGRGGPSEEEEHSEAVGEKTDMAGAGRQAQLGQETGELSPVGSGGAQGKAQGAVADRRGIF